MCSPDYGAKPGYLRREGWEMKWVESDRRSVIPDKVSPNTLSGMTSNERFWGKIPNIRNFVEPGVY
jgi:hypothetical protein